MDQIVSLITTYVVKKLNRNLLLDEQLILNKQLSMVQSTNYVEIKRIIKTLLNQFRYNQYVSTDVLNYEKNAKDALYSYMQDENGDNTKDKNKDTNKLDHIVKNQLKNINVKHILTHNNQFAYTLSARMNPKSKLFCAYLFLDSNNLSEQPSLTSVSIDTFKWNIHSGASALLQKGVVNLHSPLYSIKKMRIGRCMFHDISLSLIATLQSKRIVMTINECKSQAFLTPTNVKFHFIQQHLSTSGNTITLSPSNLNRGWFNFNNPITPLTSITLTFTDILTSLTPKISIPQVPLSITAVQSYGTSVSIWGGLGTYSNPLTLQLTDMALLQFFSYVTADSVAITRILFKFSGFTTSAPGASPDAATIALYNQNYVLTVVDSDIGVFKPPVSLPLGLTLGATTNVTITWLYPPRITTVLELLYELPEDETVM